ncbi:MAG: hypothetical protein DESF_02578 [Desulfovibrio sp.]
MGRKRKIIESSTSEYWIELKPAPSSASFAFHSPKQQAILAMDDYYNVIFEGVICAPTYKIELGTPISVSLWEVDGEQASGGFLQCRKGRKAELNFYIKKGYFFLMCDYIKDGTVKYVRAFGEALFRGSAAVYSMYFSSHMNDE